MHLNLGEPPAMATYRSSTSVVLGNLSGRLDMSQLAELAVCVSNIAVQVGGHRKLVPCDGEELQR